MLKIIGAILIISSSTGIGLYFSYLVKIRLEDLKDLKKCILILRGDINYAATPLPEAINGVADRINCNLTHFFIKISDELNKLEGCRFSSIWEVCVKEELKNTCLNKKDKMYLIRFGENLGFLDKETQINTIDLYISQLEHEIDELTLMVKEKTRLYNLLGIMGGIFVTIIII